MRRTWRATAATALLFLGGCETMPARDRQIGWLCPGTAKEAGIEGYATRRFDLEGHEKYASGGWSWSVTQNNLSVRAEQSFSTDTPDIVFDDEVRLILELRRPPRRIVLELRRGSVSDAAPSMKLAESRYRFQDHFYATPKLSDLIRFGAGAQPLYLVAADRDRSMLAWVALDLGGSERRQELARLALADSLARAGDFKGRCLPDVDGPPIVLA